MNPLLTDAATGYETDALAEGHTLTAVEALALGALRAGRSFTVLDHSGLHTDPHLADLPGGETHIGPEPFRRALQRTHDIVTWLAQPERVSTVIVVIDPDGRTALELHDANMLSDILEGPARADLHVLHVPLGVH